MPDRIEVAIGSPGQGMSRDSVKARPATPQGSAQLSSDNPFALKQKRFTHSALANLIAFIILATGLAFRFIPGFTDVSWRATLTEYVLQIGLFSFAGGMTNWLAVKMLFDRVPFLYGSGVIRRNFKQIRGAFKSIIMDMFFDEAFLSQYMSNKAGELLTHMQIGEKIQSILNSPEVDALIDSKLQEFAQRPEAVYLQMVGLTPQALKPAIKPFAVGLAMDVVPYLQSAISNSSGSTIKWLRREVDTLMVRKMEDIGPDRVVYMLKATVGNSIPALIVWGVIFGGVLGALSVAFLG